MFNCLLLSGKYSEFAANERGGKGLRTGGILKKIREIKKINQGIRKEKTGGC